MTFDEPEALRRFFRVLVREFGSRYPWDLSASFPVTEIHQNLVPYRTRREDVGVETSSDYGRVLLLLLAGRGDYLTIDSEATLLRILEELDSPDPNTGLYVDFAEEHVSLNPQKVEEIMTDQHFPEDAVESDILGEGGESSDPANAEGEAHPPSEACAWCRETLPQRDRVNFCPWCGSSVRLVPCPACDEELEVEWSFCINCGTEVRPQEG